MTCLEGNFTYTKHLNLYCFEEKWAQSVLQVVPIPELWGVWLERFKQTNRKIASVQWKKQYRLWGNTIQTIKFSNNICKLKKKHNIEFPNRETIWNQTICFDTIELNTCSSNYFLFKLVWIIMVYNWIENAKLAIRSLLKCSTLVSGFEERWS